MTRGDVPSTAASGTALALLVLLLGGCGEDGRRVPEAADPRAPGTIRMAERLDELLRTRDLTRLPYANSERVEAFRALDVPEDPRGLLGTG